ncbi:MAG TPA: class I SAM-dependent methyltransferase [Phycisphaerae bacterium]|jgi:predicted O-methyltransferase YrrM
MLWDELLASLEGSPVRLMKSEHSPDHRGLRMAHRSIPVSLSETEFNYLTKYIVDHDLKCGFDLATAFGVSALSMGLGLKATGGRLLSMDSYHEELSQAQPIGVSAGDLFKDADGYRMAAWLVKKFDVPVTLKCGWSPTDTVREIKEMFGKGKLDVVFLDCPKSDEDLERDLGSLAGLLAPRFAVFVHDTHTMERPSEVAEKILGVKMVNVIPQQRFAFMCISNL